LRQLLCERQEAGLLTHEYADASHSLALLRARRERPRRRRAAERR
jgi:hypothetical protein